VAPVEQQRQATGSGLRRVPGLQLKGIDGPVDAFVVVGGDREGYWPETRGVEGVVTRTIGRELARRGLEVSATRPRLA